MRDAEGKLTEGVYEDVPMADYLEKREGDELTISSSGIKKVDQQSPYHFLDWWESTAEDNGTARSRLGSLVHCVLMEPEKREAQFCIKPVPDPERHTNANGSPSKNMTNTKAYKDDVAAVVEASPDKELIEYPSLVAANKIRDTIMDGSEFEDAAALLSGDGLVELVAVARDPVTGLLCKIRLDKYVDGIDVNVKGCRSVQGHAFQRDIFNMGHYISCAFYKMVMEWAGLAWTNSILLAVELDPPHAAKPWRLDEGAIDAGESTVRAVLDRIASCRDSGTWPAYGKRIESISLAEYQYKIVDERVEQHGYES